MVEIFLVRHGLTLWNVEGRIQGISNTELAPEGLQQAKLLAENFPCDKLDAIFSSDLVRAKITAQFIADKFNLPVQTTPDFREVDFGEWEGKSFADLEKNEAETLKIFHTAPDKLNLDGAETFHKAQSRAMNKLRQIITDTDNGGENRIVIAAHGSINRLILCAVLEIPIKNMWRLNQFNTAVNIFRVDDGNFTVRLINGTAHLKGANFYSPKTSS